MALAIKPNSKWFYGRIMVNGVKKAINLGIAIKGKRPKSLKEQGDAFFERSRGQAQEKLRKLQIEAMAKKANVEILQAIHEARTGERISSIPLHPQKGQCGMHEAWKRIPRKRKPSASHAAQTKSLFERFIVFLEQRYSDKSIREMSDVRRQMANDFMISEDNRGIAPKTYNNILIAMRSAFSLLAKEAGIFENPFLGIPTKDEETIFRKPFDIDELSKIVDVANDEKHSFIRPIIYTGICTAMRRGDCCLLSRKSVNFEQNFLEVKTGKTHKIAQIPLFPLLETELRNHLANSASEYFFPDQAKMYLENPDGITWRVRKLLKDAGFFNIDCKPSEKPKAAHYGNIQAKRSTGLRAASIRDFHSFRVSWVTLALTSGVDLELVRMVTGHKSVDIVLKHYFQPGRESFKESLQSKMPGLLMNRAGDSNSEEHNSRSKFQRVTKLASLLKESSVNTLDSKLLDEMERLLGGLSSIENSRAEKL